MINRLEETRVERTREGHCQSDTHWRRHAWKGREKAIVNQTHIRTVLKATRRKLQGDRLDGAQNYGLILVNSTVIVLS